MLQAVAVLSVLNQSLTIRYKPFHATRMQHDVRAMFTGAVMTEKTKGPFLVKASASLASLAMLLAISSYNVVPTLRRAADGDVAAIGLAAVQIAFTIILAVIPFVPGWSADTRRLLTLAFMIGNGYFAFEISGHRHDGERTAQNQHQAIVDELTAKKAELQRLGAFTVTDDYQVTYAENAAKVAEADKAAARTSVKTEKDKLPECERKCGTLEREIQRLEGEAKQKDAEAKAAHDELQKLSGWRTLTKQAAPISARIDELQVKLDNEQYVTETGSSTETGRTIEALLIALLIELGNRFGPEALFKFIFFAAGFPLVLPLHFKGDAEEKSAPVPFDPLDGACPGRSACHADGARRRQARSASACASQADGEPPQAGTESRPGDE